MSEQTDSLFKSMLRSFFKSIGAFLGVFIAIFIGIIMIGISAADNHLSTNTYQSELTSKIQPDDEGNVIELSASSPVILQIDIVGTIGLDKLTFEHIYQRLLEAEHGKTKDRIKAIFLKINTPGGVVIDSDQIYRALMTYKHKHSIPIYAYVDGLCASGGMYIACAADKIFSSPSSLIGSVGVLLPTFFNISQPLEQHGILTKTIIAGKNKDEMNPLRPWSENESQNYQEITDIYYQQFVDIVAANRTEMSKEKLINEYGARIFIAEKAKDLGYIDYADASREQALLALKYEAGIKEKYQVISFQTQNWYKELFTNKLSFLEGKVEHSFLLPGSLDKNLEGKFLYYYHPKF